ncbi:MAG: N-acetylmuramoyl-L-alanine amidase [Firmicutes bacterium]|nr:N-acetylmuramoyl-L-alanine amidase [Bacillota bacterium]
MRLQPFPGRILLVMLATALTSLPAAWWVATGRAGEPPPVMLDPGHGGIDGGASREGMLEKAITLDVALRTRRHLEAFGVPVRLTREEDVDLGGPPGSGRHGRDLAERVRRTREAGAALVVSLHVNSTRDPEEAGMMFFYLRGSAEGERLARSLAGALASLHRRREEPVPRENLYVLSRAGVPAVLIELGFLTNPGDRERLGDPHYREQVALRLALALQAYYRQLQKPQAPAVPGPAQGPPPYTGLPRHIY